jgi:hypothetical protein
MRMASILERSADIDEDPDAEETLKLQEALNLALDELAIAHAAPAFEFLCGPIKWKK